MSSGTDPAGVGARVRDAVPGDGLDRDVEGSDDVRVLAEAWLAQQARPEPRKQLR